MDLRNIGKDSGAYIILKNINKLTTKELEKIEVKGDSIDEIENSIIKEHVGQFKIKNEENMTKILMRLFSDEKGEGETNTDFEKRLVDNVMKIFENENKKDNT